MSNSSSFDALMEAAVDAIIIIDREGRIEAFNRAAVAMFGYTAPEVIGRNVRVLMPEPVRSRHDGYLVNYRHSGRTVMGRSREETARRKNGENFPVLLTVSEFRRAGGRKFVGFLRDMSETQATQEKIHRLEEQLLHADRLVALGELTAGIAHEINQPLTAIAAYADAGRALIDRHGKTSTEDMHSICERIGRQSRRAAEVVQRLRKLVRAGSTSKAMHDINEIVNNVLLLFEYEEKKHAIEIHFEALPEARKIYVDEIQIQQLLVNLVKNSFDALIETGQGGGRVGIELADRGVELLVTVSDNGPGVPADQRHRLFDAFFTTKPKGVGLGLSICRSIATAHGGSLRHEDGQSGGSRFTLSLPLQSIG